MLRTEWFLFKSPMNTIFIRRKNSTYFHHFLTILRYYVFDKEIKCNLVQLQERAKDSDKKQSFDGIKESTFAEKTFSSKHFFAIILVVLVP